MVHRRTSWELAPFASGDRRLSAKLLSMTLRFPVDLKWPLTGRAEELHVIEAAVSDPDCSGIVICGAAGVGKSRMAREALASAASKGGEVRWAVATSSAR